MTAQTWDEAAVRLLVEQEFSELLPGPGLGGEENFFRRGGDSFDMMRLISTLNSHGLPLTARDFVARPTSDGVVQSVMARLRRGADDADR